MTDADEIARRHLLAVDSLEATLQSEQQYIRIFVADRWASSHGGQLLTSCLVNLLCRQVKLVRHIEIVAPLARGLIRLPGADPAEAFPACLRGLALWAVNGAVTLSATRTATRSDHTIFVGDPWQEVIPDHGHTLIVVGDGWRALVGDAHYTSYAIWPTSINPLGPFLAAALAAGEIFKRSRGIRRGRYLSADGYSLWSGAKSSDWNALAEGPPVSGICLPPTHVVGAGAVGNALAYVIANIKLNGGYLVLVDDDKYDKTNLNRCLLAGWEDRDHAKVDAIAKVLRAAGIGVFPFPGTIMSYLTHSRTQLRVDVARQVDDLIFEIVASCVDKGTSRQDIQGLQPHLLVGGSTLDLQAKASWYSGRPGAACLACFNPAEQNGEKFRALESQLRNMPADDRIRLLAGHGLDAPAVEEYLSSAQCGGLGEAALKDFATRPPSEFSAGFVSLGAGLLLASELLRQTVFLATAPPRFDMTTLNFLNGGFADAGLGADNACEWNCQGRRRAGIC
jgi:hypothetical protein